MLFEYHVKNSDDQLVSGEIEADSNQEAVVRLKAQNLKVIEIYKKKSNQKKQKNVLFNENEVSDFLTQYVILKSNHLDEKQILEIIEKQSNKLKIRHFCRYLQKPKTRNRDILDSIIEANSYFNPAIRESLLFGRMKKMEDLEITRNILKVTNNHLHVKRKLIDLEMNGFFCICLFLSTFGFAHILANIYIDVLTPYLPNQIIYFTTRYGFTNVQFALFYILIVSTVFVFIRPMSSERLYLVKLFSQLRQKYRDYFSLIHLEMMLQHGSSLQRGLNVLIEDKESSQFARKILNKTIEHKSKTGLHTQLELAFQTELFTDNQNLVQSILNQVRNETELQLENEIMNVKLVIFGLFLCVSVIFFSVVLFGFSVCRVKGL